MGLATIYLKHSCQWSFNKIIASARSLHSLVERSKKSCRRRKRERENERETHTEWWKVMKRDYMTATCHLETGSDGLITHSLWQWYEHTSAKILRSHCVVYVKYAGRCQTDSYYPSLLRSTAFLCVCLDNKLQDPANDHSSWRREDSSTWDTCPSLNPYLTLWV